MTTYVKITKATNPEYWYAHEDFIDAVFEVRQCPNIPEDWAIITSRHGRNILKSDCEVVALPHLNGQHLISTEQLQTIYQVQQQVNTTQSHILMGQLKAWFPQVFQPEKRYKAGQRFSLKLSPTVFRIVQYPNHSINLLNETYDMVCAPVPVPCYDPNDISPEEFRDLAAAVKEKPEDFTLLPDTTDSMV